MVRFSQIICFLLLTWTQVDAQIEKVEPPNWWSNMNYNQLEIMFYGPGLGLSDVKVTDGIAINSITKTENPNYIFINVDLSNQPERIIEFEFANDHKVYSYQYNIDSRKEDSSVRKGFNSSDLIYLMMPDRFANGDTSNDTVGHLFEPSNRKDPNGRHGGDIQGIIDHLDYIDSLGATTIWCTPLLEDNMQKYSYHHYAQTDVYNIDPRFGDNALYQKLSTELHKREMKLIMDYVTNHWGTNHWIIEDLPTHDWIHQFPEYTNTNHRMTTQFDVNKSERDAKYSEEGWFVPTMADLNQGNPLVINYLIQNAIWWIEFAALDGLRVDTYSYNDKEAIAQWTKTIMNEYPNFNIVGEAWYHDQAQLSYWQKDSPIAAIQNYNSYCPSVMDFTLHDAIMDVFRDDTISWGKGMIKVYENLTNDFLYADINNIVVFAENHDTPRINEYYPDINIYKMMITLIATTRGIPQIYYGSEVGMKGKKNYGDGDIRRDFPGGWQEDTQSAFSSAGRTDRQSEYYDFSSKIFNWRKGKKSYS